MKLTELTDREKQILQLLAKGMNSAEIGQELSLSSQTIENTIRTLRRLVSNSNNNTQLVYEAVKNGLI